MDAAALIKRKAKKTMNLKQVFQAPYCFVTAGFRPLFQVLEMMPAISLSNP